MAFGVLFVLLIGTAGWWLYSRWAEVRDAQEARRQAELLFVVQARHGAAVDTAPAATPAFASGEFHPTQPGPNHR